ncbi:hypothetical protein MesoLj113a_44860 [Mesorhizobium sp. 113-1-2]|nr:PAS protein [Mesorhizobium loti]BCG73328.1 hypothetical protein MesoLj113a_44860 [Mesorhizobium sp. 113-1-2]
MALGSSELVSYAQKFWDAENNVITIIYGLTFAVYVIIAQYPDVRRMIKEYYTPLMIFASSGNILLVVLLVRLWWIESYILVDAGYSPTMQWALMHACVTRVLLVVFNFAMYATVLRYVKVKPIGGQLFGKKLGLRSTRQSRDTSGQ